MQTGGEGVRRRGFFQWLGARPEAPRTSSATTLGVPWSLGSARKDTRLAGAIPVAAPQKASGKRSLAGQPQRSLGVRVLWPLSYA